MIAKRVIYEGRVQGVGFRYTAKNLARGFDVTGWVKNLPDGRVHLEAAAANETELNAFLEEIAVNSPLSHHIKNAIVETIPAAPGQRGFEIVS